MFSLDEAYKEFDERSHQVIVNEMEEDIFRDILQRFGMELVGASVPKRTDFLQSMLDIVREHSIETAKRLLSI